MNPTIQEFVVQELVKLQTPPTVSGIPRSSWKVRFAPLEPSTCLLANDRLTQKTGWEYQSDPILE
jgi:hypothetical protein